MNRFAELLDRLAYEPGRNNKLRLLTNYFRTVEDPDRGYALAAVTGFPVVFSADVPIALVSFLVITVLAVAIVAIPGHLASRVRPAISFQE